MIYNISFDIASLFIQFCIIVVLASFYKITNISDKFYRLFVYSLVVSSILDITRIYLIDHFSLVSLNIHYIINSLYLISSQFAIFFAFVYIVSSIIVNTRSAFLFSIFTILINIVLLIINYFTGILFFLIDGKLYRGVYHPLIYAICGIFIIYGVVMLVYHRDKFTKKQLFINYLFVLIPILSAVIQQLNPSTLMVCFGGTMSAMLILFSLETPDEMRQIELERKYAEDANKAKSQFFVSMSHEIRTPVNTIMGMNEVILREATEPSIRKYAMDVKFSANTLLSLINDFLDLSKMESGKMEIIPVEYDLSEMIYELTTMMKVKAEDKGLIFNVNVQASLPRKYYGDNIRIRQILINLLTNAIKYTHTGSVSLIVNGITMEDETQLHFEVMDTGIGIKPENINYITENFTRIEENHNRTIEGTGLGLGIVKYLLTQMNSSLDVESLYGKGSIFSFNLTQPTRSTEMIGNFMDKVKNATTYYTYKIPFIAPEANILLVDDNALNRKVFCQLLKNLQINIKEADSGFIALDFVQKEKFDIIFLDHMMPEMDGIETMRKFKELENNLNKSTPVVMLTANVVLNATETYFNEGFCDYITKPISPDKLEQLIKTHIPNDKIRKIVGKNTIQNKLELDDYVEGLPALDEFDWDYARKFYKNKDMLTFTLKNVCESLGNEAYKLDSLYENIQDEKNLNDYRITVHALKSTMAMVGGLLLSKLARLCEVASKDHDYKRLEMLHPILIEEMFKHRDRLLVFTKSEDNIKIKFNKIEVKKVLDELAQSLENSNYKAADKLSEKLNSYEYDELLMGYIEKISMQIVQFDTNDALDTIKILNNLLAQRT